MNATRTDLLIYTLLVIALILYPKSLAAQCAPEDFVVKVSDSHMRSERLDKNSRPDPRLRAYLTPYTQSCKPHYTSTTQREIAECNNPFLGLVIPFCNVPPNAAHQLVVIVNDSDGKDKSPQLLTFGHASLPIASVDSRMGSQSEDYLIQTKTRVVPTDDCYKYSLLNFRNLPSSALPSTNIDIPVAIAISDTFQLDKVTLLEEIPPGFTYVSSTLSPDSVVALPGGGDEILNDEDFGTLVSWTFNSPSISDFFVFEYTVTTPASADDIAQAFGHMIHEYQDGVFARKVGNPVSLDNVVIGGVLDDCNSNMIDDRFDLVDATSMDCNLNSIPDECDIASGSSKDCNLNMIPDGCDIEAGISLDMNLDGIPDECESTVSIDDPPRASVGLSLQAWPNPVSGKVSIGYNLVRSGLVKIVVYDSAGRRVATIVDGWRPEGSARYSWEAVDNGGVPLAPGVYYLALTMGNETYRSKLTIVE